MSHNQQNSLFTELTDRESATVSGASMSCGIGVFKGSSSQINDANATDAGKEILFTLPKSGQFYIYDPTRSRPFKTLVV
ncbi:MAG: secretion protein HlyD [Microcoleus sp.]